MSANNCLLITKIEDKFYGFDAIVEEPAEEVSYTPSWACIAADSLEEACMQAARYCSNNEVECGLKLDSTIVS